MRGGGGGAALVDGKGASRGVSLGWMGPHASLNFPSSFLLKEVPHLYHIGKSAAEFRDNNTGVILLRRPLFGYDI